MLTYLKTRPAVFDPDEIVILSGALNKAWRFILASSVPLNGNAEGLREMLAKHIVEAAQRGELNQNRLRDDAVAHVMSAMNLQPPPRIDIRAAR